MSDAHQSSAETLKLAHQLGVPSAELGFLNGVSATDLRQLRRQIGDALFNADKHHFSTVVAVSKVIPAPLAARITEFALPPLIAARTAELLEPSRAIDMVNRLSDGYLADVSAAMDPARAPQVIAAMPAERVASVGSELARRREWVVMGGFVSHVAPDALRAALRNLTGEQLLRIGFVLDDVSRLDEIAELVSADQLDSMLAAAVKQDLWAELDELLGHLDAPRAQRLADRYAVADQATVIAVEAAVDAGSLSAESLTKLAAA